MFARSSARQLGWRWSCALSTTVEEVWIDRGALSPVLSAKMLSGMYDPTFTLTLMTSLNFLFIPLEYSKISADDRSAAGFRNVYPELRKHNTWIPHTMLTPKNWCGAAPASSLMNLTFLWMYVDLFNLQLNTTCKWVLFYRMQCWTFFVHHVKDPSCHWSVTIRVSVKWKTDWKPCKLVSVTFAMTDWKPQSCSRCCEQRKSLRYNQLHLLRAWFWYWTLIACLMVHLKEPRSFSCKQRVEFYTIYLQERSKGEEIACDGSPPYYFLRWIIFIQCS